MRNEKINKAFDLIREAATLLKDAHDESSDSAVRYICRKCEVFLLDAGNALMNLVSTED